MMIVVVIPALLLLAHLQQRPEGTLRRILVVSGSEFRVWGCRVHFRARV